MFKYLWLCCFIKFVLPLELTDIDDSFATVWQSDKLIRGSSECKVQTKSGVKYGVCTAPTTCIFSGGRANGFCGVLATCCIYENSCNKESDTKVGYFEANDLKNGETACSYNIKLRNRNICQVRLDFIKFNLAPATLTIPQYGTSKVYKCIDDRMKITPNHYNIPDLCGNNDKQHVYIHVNQTDGVTKGVRLEMVLADRNYNSQLTAPSWKIKVTQLECPGNRGIIVPSTDVADDFPSLAPLGAIQYFTDAAGYFKSFGFDGSVLRQQSYTYEQKYAIAFKRDINVCGIKFNPEYLYLPNDLRTGFLTDKNCHHYLFVPELYFDDQLSTSNTLVSKVCLTRPEAFRSYAPGPLLVHFNSMATDFATDENIQQGFNIKYELLSKCQ